MLSVTLNVRAEDAPPPWTQSVFASFDGMNITGEMFARNVMLLGYFDERESLINLKIIEQLAKARGTAISAEEIDIALRQKVEEMIADGSAKSLDDMLAAGRMTLDEVRESVRLRLALFKMVGAEKGVKQDEIPQVVPVWLREQQQKAAVIRLVMTDPAALLYCASVNEEKISTFDLLREILRRRSDAEISDFLGELLDFYLLKKHLEDAGESITHEDLLAELKRLEDEVIEDPQFNGVSLLDILASQKKTIDSLMSEPGFQLRAMMRKACDAKVEIPVADQKKFFEEHKLDFAQREVLLRIISIYFETNDGKPRADMTQKQAVDLATEIRKRLDAGEAFDKLAETYTEEPGLKQTGGLVGNPLGESATVFQYLPELKVVFTAKEGEILGPILTRYGAHIVKLEKIKDKSFEDVQAKVYKQMRMDTRKKWLEDLRKTRNAKSSGTVGVLKVFFPALTPGN